MKTRCEAMATHQRFQEVPALPLVNLLDDQDRLQPHKPNQGYHHLRDRLRASKATVAIWVKCMGRVALNMVPVLEA